MNACAGLSFAMLLAKHCFPFAFFAGSFRRLVPFCMSLLGYVCVVCAFRVFLLDWLQASQCLHVFELVDFRLAWRECVRVVCSFLCFVSLDASLRGCCRVAGAFLCLFQTTSRRLRA